MEADKGAQINIALDIGGTLTKVGISCNQDNKKLVFDSPNDTIDKLQITNRSSQKLITHTFYFKIYSCFEDFWTFFHQKIISNFSVVNIIATGGGALKYQSCFNSLKENCPKTSIHFQISLNEFEAILPAVELLLEKNHSCKFNQDFNQKSTLLIGKVKHQNEQKEQNHLAVPLILANIGSGMSVIKLEEKQGNLKFERMGGSALAGGFFVGVQKIMNSQFDFEKFSKQSQPQNLPSEQLEIMNICVKNLSQIISLYSDISKINTILLTGGMTRAPLIKEEFFKNLQNKRIWFTQIDGYLGVTGMLLNATAKMQK